MLKTHCQMKKSRQMMMMIWTWILMTLDLRKRKRRERNIEIWTSLMTWKKIKRILVIVVQVRWFYFFIDQTKTSSCLWLFVDPWTGSDRDYQYDELLQRVFGIMRDKNPEMVSGKQKKFVMRPPQVVRVGSKKTAFANFIEIAKMLHRQPKHLLQFLFAGKLQN